jgi:hypothetical protein
MLSLQLNGSFEVEKAATQAKVKFHKLHLLMLYVKRIILNKHSILGLSNWMLIDFQSFSFKHLVSKFKYKQVDETVSLKKI